MMAQLEQYLHSADIDTPALNQSSTQPLPKRESIKHFIDWFSPSRY